jgi:hypothetical protein
MALRVTGALAVWLQPPENQYQTPDQSQQQENLLKHKSLSAVSLVRAEKPDRPFFRELTADSPIYNNQR